MEQEIDDIKEEGKSLLKEFINLDAIEKETKLKKEALRYKLMNNRERERNLITEILNK